VNDKVAEMLEGIGLKTARQRHGYEGKGVQGENIYSVLAAPRGDATEAIVLVASWRNGKGEINRKGVTLLLTLARYFRRWSLWSKDIIFLVTPDSAAGPQAWVDAYHDSHTAGVESLPVKSGALQGALVIDYVKEDRFKSIHIAYDGVNGALPNLDLVNSVVSIAGGQMGMGVGLQEMWTHRDTYRDRLETMLRGMLKQGLGTASGAHSAFIPYHVDAVTLSPYGDGWQDEMAMGRVIEGTFRSLNNLLEKLHQSFFFYLLMSTERFVSIGTYLPSAMLVAVNFTFTSIALWIKSGMPEADVGTGLEGKRMDKARLGQLERDLFLPLGVVVVIQALGVVPLGLFNLTPQQVCRFPSFFSMMTLLTNIAPGPRLRHLHYPEPRSAIRPVDITANLQSNNPAIPTHPFLLSPAVGHVPIHARNSQLLAIPLGRSSRQPVILRSARLTALGDTAGFRQPACGAGYSNCCAETR
jgi:glycosylphosphatidylinositol transamidase